MENYTTKRLLEMLQQSTSFRIGLKHKLDREGYQLYICSPFDLIWDNIEICKAEFLNLMLEFVGFLPNDDFRELNSFYYAETYTHIYTYAYLPKDKLRIQKYIVDDLSKIKEKVIGTISELEFRNQEIFPEDNLAL